MGYILLPSIFYREDIQSPQMGIRSNKLHFRMQDAHETAGLRPRTGGPEHRKSIIPGVNTQQAPSDRK